MSYQAPLKEIRFALEQAELTAVCALPGYEDCNVELTDAILDEALATDYIDESELQTLQDWRKDPQNWGQTVKKLKTLRLSEIRDASRCP